MEAFLNPPLSVKDLLKDQLNLHCFWFHFPIFILNADRFKYDKLELNIIYRKIKQ